MLPGPEKTYLEVKEEENELPSSVEVKNGEYELPGSVEVKNAENELGGSSSPGHLENNLQEFVNASSSGHLEEYLQGSVDTSSIFHLENNLGGSVDAFSSEDEDNSQNAGEEDSPSNENALNQLVVYDPLTYGTGEIVPVPDPIYHQPRTGVRNYNLSSRVLPSVGAFTVQCANCFKWRLIPTKQKYEEIREFISENPFFCETAREWRPDISCDDPADIHQDGSRLWAIDKPNIAQPPPGWQRLLRIRAEGGSKFADVYYVAPSGKRLRSMVEIQRYLCQHPEYATEAVQPSQFSFQIPKPLQENYVRKRPARLPAIEDGNHLEMSRLLEHTKVNPLAWAGPAETTDLQLGGPGLSTPYFEAPVFDPVSRPAKKQARRATSKEMFSNQLYNPHAVKLEEPRQSINDEYDL